MVVATFFSWPCRVYFRRTDLLRAGRSAKQTVQLPPNERAAWNRLKIAIMELYSRYESTETPRQKALRSWAGTLVICAGLCMIGIVLEVRYNTMISTRSVVSGLTGEQPLSPRQLQRCSNPGHAQASRLLERRDRRPSLLALPFVAPPLARTRRILVGGLDGSPTLTAAAIVSAAEMPQDRGRVCTPMP